MNLFDTVRIGYTEWMRWLAPEFRREPGVFLLWVWTTPPSQIGVGPENGNAFSQKMAVLVVRCSAIADFVPSLISFAYTLNTSTAITPPTVVHIPTVLTTCVSAKYLKHNPENTLTRI